MYFGSVDRFSQLFCFNITFLKIAFIVVQWENENSVSVVKEKKVVGAVQLKEGTTVRHIDWYKQGSSGHL